jgi:hypothetical protein
MVRRLAVLLLMLPTRAPAHEAFGDLGPFYQAALHPLADPAQGLLLAGAAVLLARQPITTVRRAYAALVLAGVATLAVGVFVALPVPGLRAMALTSLALAAATLVRPRQTPAIAVVLAAGIGLLAALSLDHGIGARAALLGLLGGGVGIALATLYVWGAAEWADRRISPLATSIAAAWVAAIALMAAALPA